WVALELGTRSSTGMLSILYNEYAIDEHGGIVACRVSMWIRVGRPIIKVVRIEDDDVGRVTWQQQSAITQLKRFGRKSRHLAYGGFQRQGFALTHITRQNTREGAIKARMRHALACNAAVG